MSASKEFTTKYLDLLENTGTLNGEQLKELHRDLLAIDGRTPRSETAFPPEYPDEKPDKKAAAKA